MQKTVDSVLQNPATRALILVLLIVPVSIYLGTSPVRRGLLYYAEAFAPAIAAALAAGLWTWSWKWLWIVLVISVALTVLMQMLGYLFW
jgi:ABC-type Mn2+/Zn2+ transport system permease subunit